MAQKRPNTLTSPSNRLWVRIKKFKYVYLMLLPVLAYYFIFEYLPIGGNLMAFQKFSITKGIWGSKWVGLDNFKKFLSTYNFWQLMRNTVLISVYNLAVCFPAPIILALLLNEVRHTKFKKIVQTITYMPHFISSVVICSMVLIFLSSEGFVNAIIQFFGGEAIAFMTKAKYFRTIYVLMNLWQGIGWSSIIYIAAIAGILCRMLSKRSVYRNLGNILLGFAILMVGMQTMSAACASIAVANACACFSGLR